MDVGTFTQLITTLGFPTVMCLSLLWYTKELIEKHKQETDEFTKALNNNTLVLQKLCDTIGMEREEK